MSVQHVLPRRHPGGGCIHRLMSGEGYVAEGQRAYHCHSLCAQVDVGEALFLWIRCR